MIIDPTQLELSDQPRVATAVVCSQCGRVEHDLRAHTCELCDAPLGFDMRLFPPSRRGAWDRFVRMLEADMADRMREIDREIMAA